LDAITKKILDFLQKGFVGFCRLYTVLVSESFYTSSFWWEEQVSSRSIFRILNKNRTSQKYSKYFNTRWRVEEQSLTRSITRILNKNINQSSRKIDNTTKMASKHGDDEADGYLQDFAEWAVRVDFSQDVEDWMEKYCDGFEDADLEGEQCLEFTKLHRKYVGWLESYITKYCDSHDINEDRFYKIMEDRLDDKSKDSSVRSLSLSLSLSVVSQPTHTHTHTVSPGFPSEL
jgi:hypothetical protein